MSLAIRCRDSFLPQDVSRGNQYFRNDRAVLANATDHHIHFTVFGSSDSYAVEFELESIEDGLVAAYCECPRFDDGYFCKHLWASLREIDARVDFPGDRTLKLYFNDDPDLDFQPKSQRTTAASQRKKKTAQSWKKPFQTARKLLSSSSAGSVNRLDQVSGGRKKIWYVLRREDLAYYSHLLVRTYESTRKHDAEWGVPCLKGLSIGGIEKCGNPQDREILQLLKPAADQSRHDRFASYYAHDSFVLSSGDRSEALRKLAASGRFVWSTNAQQHLREMETLAWDSRVWRLRFCIEPSDDDPKQVQVQAALCCEQEERSPQDVVACYSDGYVLFPGQLSLVSEADSRWLDALIREPMVPVPLEDLDELLSTLTSLPSVPKLEIDDRLEVNHASPTPTGKVVISYEERKANALIVEPFVKYGDVEFALADERTEAWQAEERTLLRRNADAESDWVQRLQNFPFEQVFHHATDERLLTIPLKRFVPLTHQLVADGWEVVAHGKTIRQPSSFDVRIQSDSDWFDLQADANFDGISASLPSLLSALRQRSQFVTLDDGSQGVLPEEWLEKYARLAEVATVGEEDNALRFAKSQALLLDALLSEQENVSADRDFSKLCKKLKAFEGIAPGKEPRGFQGELRDYQRDGVGWFGFLREFGFGGCLADDMGLGKTVQVLAMLQGRRVRRLKKDEERLPSIVIVPKSLVFNWMDEANKFAPKLRTLNYTGLERAAAFEQSGEIDLLITTYGTLRRDIEKLKELSFDYVILDESQAVKNAKSLAAKAVRLVNAKHRLAMTGTPVENHLGELWALFDFLNPGMLGSGATFKRIARSTNDSESLSWLSNAIRPFILRRTKKQVLTELPDKTEQTLVCEMTPKQKKKYKELRDYYRAHLSKKVDDMGINRAKIHVLEALLRLRQAACDPRLLGESEPSGAKIELLVEQLSGLLRDGHKALVFSQFTSLLALVRDEFDERGWVYEYLDGKTRNRAAKVERFQNDPDCSLFLISMKAGGSGLNLTSADYVFILDPWWNPAVEAQAVDRAHRIGQTKSVMAYRILCKDTVEDKIITMQQSKRDLADAIITADKSLISQLSLDDIQLLLE